MKHLSIVLFALAGCTMMVNGKPRRIGGDPDPTPAAQTASAPAAQTASASAPAQAARPLAPGQVISVDASIGRDPLVVSMDAVFDSTWSKVFGEGRAAPECGPDTTARPIGSFQVAKHDTELSLTLAGGTHGGFVVRNGDLHWTSCDWTMKPIKDGWQPGRYDIYPLQRNGHNGSVTYPYRLELSRPNAPIVADKAHKLVIDGKLDKPVLVELTLAANRRERAAKGCEKLVFTPTPDLVVSLERPVAGLTIRPLPAAAPITVLLEKAGTAKRSPQNFCVKTRADHRGSDAPSYVTSSELRFGNDDEGVYGIALGTPRTNEEIKVTLLVYDASTKLDPLYVRPFGGEQPTLEQRWIGYQMPQLDADELGSADTYEEAALAAKVFAAVPKQALVYAKLTFDKDLGGGEGWPVKNEPLVLLALQNERATVLTADGMRLQIKASHVVLAPDGPTELPAAPRGATKRDIGRTIAMLSPAQKKLGEAHEAQVKNRDACLDRAWEPYRRQLPSYTRPAGVDVVVYKSARTKQIEEAGQRAMDSKCGTDEAFEKRTEATRVKLAAEVEKARAKLLAEATANLK